MDCRSLWLGNRLQASKYAMQYTTKRQSVLDNIAVVEMAMKNRIEREKHSYKTDYQREVGRLISLAYATSGSMEIGGRLAAVILLDGASGYFS